MQLSRQEEYGLRCLVQVARHQGEEPLTIPEIAAAEGLSTEYAAKLLRILRRGGLVTSTRGAGGGYRLAQPPEQTNLWTVLNALGEPFYDEAFCGSHAGQRQDCVHNTDCSIRALWSWVGQALERTLGAVSMADLIQGEAGMAGLLDVQAAVPLTSPGAIVQLGDRLAARIEAPASAAGHDKAGHDKAGHDKAGHDKAGHDKEGEGSRS